MKTKWFGFALTGAITLMSSGCLLDKLGKDDSMRTEPLAPVAGRCEGVYRVQAGDNLKIIAERFQCDFAQLAQYNHLYEPFHVTPGQNIVLSGGAGLFGSLGSPTLMVEEVPAQSEPVDHTAAQQPTFGWPGTGAVRPSAGARRGIEIAGQQGSPVFASAPGRVVYKGTGVKGYGEFVIIKHDSGYLSAYGNTASVTVNEGDQVTSGQMIGRMGQGFHFEIRKDGTPLDPLQYLPKR